MNRSVGVTVIAILSLLGSILTLLMGILMMVIMALMPIPSPDTFNSPPIFFKIILVGVSLMYVLPAIWGIFTSIGLFRLKNWARISMIVFSVLLILMSGFGLLMALAIPFISVQSKNVDSQGMMIMGIFMGFFHLVLLGIGIWWLVFFTRAKVIQQFVHVPAMPAGGLPVQTTYPTYAPTNAMVAAPSGSGRPLSITIIAWFLLVGCLFIPLNLALGTPAALFTRALTGWPAALCFLVFMALNLYIAIGLLRLKPAARIAGIAYFVFGFANSAVFYFAPGSHARIVALMEMQQSMFPWMRSLQNQPNFQFDPMPFIIIGKLFGLIVFTVPLYFLITRKQAFEKTAAASGD